MRLYRLRGTRTRLVTQQGNISFTYRSSATNADKFLIETTLLTPRWNIFGKNGEFRSDLESLAWPPLVVGSAIGNVFEMNLV